jgi:hypothetical protein
MFTLGQEVRVSKDHRIPALRGRTGIVQEPHYGSNPACTSVVIDGMIWVICTPGALSPTQ